MMGARKPKPRPIARASSFHYHYIDLCQAAKVRCAEEVHPAKSVKTVLEFGGDKLSFLDWQLVNEALRSDLVLEVIDVRLRRRAVTVDEAANSAARAKNSRHRPVLATKYVFANFTAALANCVANSHNLRVLHLEGLPLSHEYMQTLAKAVVANEHLTDISLERSHIEDKGCEHICPSVAYLMNVSRLNLAGCDITHQGIRHIAEMFKIQKVNRFSLGWVKSLNYCDRRDEDMPGLHWLSLARNPRIGDEGLKTLLAVLKQDVWIKVINMEQCGLTDKGGSLIVDCLAANEYISEFHVAAQNNITWPTLNKIGQQLNQTLAMSEWMIGQLKEQIASLDDAVARETHERKRIDELNFQLNDKLLVLEEQLRLKREPAQLVNGGYVLVEVSWLQKLLQEQPEFPQTELGLLAPLTFPQMEETVCSRQLSDESPRREERPREPPAATAKPQATTKPGLGLRQVRSAAKYEEPQAKGRKESKSSHAMTPGHEKGAIPKAIQFERLQIGDAAGEPQLAALAQSFPKPMTPQANPAKAKPTKASDGYNLPLFDDWDESQAEEYGFQSISELPSALEPPPDWESQGAKCTMTPRSLFLGSDWRQKSC